MKNSLTFIIVFMLALSTIQLLIPEPELKTTAASPPPDDNVNGAYVQYITGDWRVSGVQTYTDESIVLNGSLFIESTGQLTLKNVTLAINCSAGNGQFWIEVYSGGKLIITDGDNDPETNNDRSNITDSPFDADNGSTEFDFRYYFKVNSLATFSINNSIVRECGYYRTYQTYGLYIATNSAIVENCTFENDYYGVYFYSGKNFDIKNNIFYNCYSGLNTGSLVEDSKFYNNVAHHNKYGFNFAGKRLTLFNLTAHNNSEVGMSLSGLSDSELQNSTMVYNGGTSWTHNLFIGFLKNLLVHHNVIQKLKPSSYHAVMIRDTSDLYFYNNIVTYNDDQAVRCDLYTNDKNVRFFNNNFSNNQGIGLSVYGNYITTSYVEIKDNVFYNNMGYGISFAKLLNYLITNNTITGGSGCFVDASQNGEFSNNTIAVSGTSFYIRDTYGSNSDTFFETINCSYDESKVWLTQGYATLIISNYLNVLVEDKNGPAPWIDVLVESKADPNYYFIRKTNNYGYIKYVVLRNQTQKNTISGTEYKYYDPYNITASNQGFTAYGESEPTMSKSQTVMVYFNTDLPPIEPTELHAASNGTDVVLTWTPSPSSDLDHYLVYRNDSVVGWSEVYNSSSVPLQKTWPTWTDKLAAATPATYWYKVQAVDKIHQRSGFSNIARCGDWVIDTTKVVTEFSIVLNGSLIVAPTGDITFKNAQIVFNNSYNCEFGIEVQPGGKLAIMDKDNDPQTKYDGSHITVLNPSENFYFKAFQAEVSIKNSKINHTGSNDGLGYSYWQVNQAYLVVAQGEPATRGLYLYDCNVDIQYNEFYNNFVSILLNDCSNSTVSNNTFSNNIFDIYLSEGKQNIIEFNKFTNSLGFPIYIYGSENNLVYSNYLNNPSHMESGIALNGLGSQKNRIIDNTIINAENGVYVFYSGIKNTIKENYFYGQGNGVYVYNSGYNTIIDNDFENMYNSGVYLRFAFNNIIHGGKIKDSKYGCYMRDSYNNLIQNITIENSTEAGVLSSWCDNIRISNLTIENCLFGIGFAGGQNDKVFNASISNCSIGILGYYGYKNNFVINVALDSTVDESVILLDFEEMIFVNCSFLASNYNFNLTDSTVILFNTTYNQSKNILDKTSKIQLNWPVHIQVIDWYGNPAKNVNVQIRRALGTLIMNGYTDNYGNLKWVWLLERTQFFSSNETVTPYFIISTSGNHSGTITLNLNFYTSIKVFMDNEAPIASNIIINPINPTTVSNLKLTYTYTDEEFDPEDATKIIWYVNGVHKSLYDNFTDIGSQYTNKGETWFCEVIPHDGAVFGTPMTSTPVTILNTKPVVSNARILEQTPRSDQELNVDYSYSDIDTDPEVGSQHKWFKNSGTGWVYSNVDSETLSAVYTKKDEQWKCVVRPYDGDDYGDEVETSPVLIGNTPPVVSNAVIVPTSPKSNETLKVSYEYFDLDLDTESGSIIKWFKNDIEQPSLEGIKEVAPEFTKKGEHWYYSITPKDGEEFGQPLGSTPVVIDNTAPKVINLIILPEDPTTADDLRIEYDFLDDDGDLESFETNVQWLRKREGDIDFAYTGLRVKTLSSIYTTKNEIWTCEVTPNDNYTYGKAVRATVSVTIQNSKPTVSEVLISPENPNTNSQLWANYNYLDLDTDPEVGTEIQWYRNGELVVGLKNKVTFSGNSTVKGEKWYFTVRPRDGQEFGEIVQSNTVTIQNTPPFAFNLKISPTFPLGDDELKASYIYSDVDNDNESQPEIKWFKNGIEQILYQDQFNVQSNVTEKGDLWYFKLRVFDGTDYSEEYTSHYVIIENSKAIIIFMQPAVGKIELNETETVDFSISAVDPDGDLLLFKWKLDRTTVSDGEFYEFKTDYDSEGVYNLTLTVQDVAKESFILSFGWEITVHKKNRLPTLEIIEPVAKNSIIEVDESIKFSILTSDPDIEDAPKISWYFDEVIDQQEGSSYTYTADQKAIGEHEVKVVISDGIGSVQYTWNLTIEKRVVDSGEKLFGQTYDWWGLVLAIISGIATIILFIFGFIKRQKKTSKLREYMKKIDEIIASEKKQPEKEAELKVLKKQIKDEFSMDLIIENHYIILEREVDNAIGEVRTEFLEERVSMPDELRGEVKEVLEDGVVTRDEYRVIMNKIRSNKELNYLEKSKLNSMMTRWMVEGKAEPKSSSSRGSKPRKPEVYKPSKMLDDEENEDRDNDNDEYNEEMALNELD